MDPANQSPGGMAVAARASQAKPNGGTAKRRQKAFDFSRYRTRYVALHVLYHGEGMLGFAATGPEDRSETVEGRLFAAIEKTRLCGDISAAQYSRAGRTDKGVSAFGQVVALRLRSRAAADAAALPDADQELDYCRLLNGVLPDSVRVLRWADVPDGFSARFSAGYRVYRYYFVRRGLDLAAMAQAASHLVGRWDFRNLCKMDVENVAHFERVVLGARLVKASPADGFNAANAAVGFAADEECLEVPGMRAREAAARGAEAPGKADFGEPANSRGLAATGAGAAAPVQTPADALRVARWPAASVGRDDFRAKHSGPAAGAAALEAAHEVWYVEVVGHAFLWHQIRCIMGVLFLIGRGDEDAEMMRQLLLPVKEPAQTLDEAAGDQAACAEAAASAPSTTLAARAEAAAATHSAGDQGEGPFSREAGKPAYRMAPDGPLVLYHCHFAGLRWRLSPEAMQQLLSQAEQRWSEAAIRLHREAAALRMLHTVHAEAHLATPGLGEVLTHSPDEETQQQQQQEPQQQATASDGGVRRSLAITSTRVVPPPGEALPGTHEWVAGGAWRQSQGPGHLAGQELAAAYAFRPGDGPEAAAATAEAVDRWRVRAPYLGFGSEYFACAPSSYVPLLRAGREPTYEQRISSMPARRLKKALSKHPDMADGEGAAAIRARQGELDAVQLVPKAGAQRD